MTKPKEKVELPNGKLVSKFIRFPALVRDGTVRCISCGQIDEIGWHDGALCRGGSEEQSHG